jgi:hypothetical protein
MYKGSLLLLCGHARSPTFSHFLSLTVDTLPTTSLGRDQICRSTSGPIAGTRRRRSPSDLATPSSPTWASAAGASESRGPAPAPNMSPNYLHVCGRSRPLAEEVGCGHQESVTTRTTSPRHHLQYKRNYLLLMKLHRSHSITAPSFVVCCLLFVVVLYGRSVRLFLGGSWPSAYLVCFFVCAEYPVCRVAPNELVFFL